MLGTLTLACNTCNPSLKCSRIIGNKVQTRIGCVRGRWVATVFDGFRRFLTVFDGFQLFSTVFNCFQLFSIVFNGVSLHEVNTHGVMWSVIGEVFFSFFVYYYFIIIFIFVLYSKNQLLVRLGVLGFCLLTPTVWRTCIQNYVGDATYDCAGCIMEPESDNNKCLGH